VKEQSKVLEGKVAVVTGAGRGIGKAIALAYAKAGASVCCAARTQSEIEKTVRAMEADGGRGLAVVADVTELDDVERIFSVAAEAFGGIDIVVINAGISYRGGPVEESDPAQWRATLDVNLFGVYYCARAAIPYLKQRGAGKIITVGSGMGHKGKAGGSAYACSKAASWMLTRVLAQELWPHRISVSELVPGPVVTAMTSQSFGKGILPPGMESEWIKQSEDVAPLALFLATQPDVGPSAQSFSLMRRDD
jgi:3-oxoacyl-[acyl-carrier protein] reductase